jgi:hypothetical protein
VTVTAIRVSGPTRVAPGASAEYTATAGFSDGSSKDVTTQATWSPTGHFGALYFTGAGTAQAANRGESVVTARLNSKNSAPLTVLVLEPGTFRVSGAVTESAGRALPGVTVEIVSGTGAGLQAKTDFRGHYALYGAAGTVELRASAEGFDQRVDQKSITNEASVDFMLTSLVPPADIAGTWLLALSPSPSCRDNFPEIARERKYEVHFVQQGTGLRLTISGPTLEVWNPDENGGTVFGQSVAFGFIGDTDYGSWSSTDLLDRLSETESLGFDGYVQGTVAGSEIRATMDGDVEYWNSQVHAFDGPTVVCRAKDHSVVLRRSTVGARSGRHLTGREP